MIIHLLAIVHRMKPRLLDLTSKHFIDPAQLPHFPDAPDTPMYMIVLQVL